MVFASLASPALALKSIVVNPDEDRIEITTLGDLYEGRGDSIQLETAPSADGSTGRMSVNAVTAGTNPNWIVFALTNPTDRAIERWLTADRYSVVGSGIVWPDLDARRLEAVTPSIGFVPERLANERADLFRVTLEPGQTITYVAELTTDRFARLYLWKPHEFELKVRDRQLFNGVMLGLTGLLAIFLTAIFAANHKLIFPAAALVAWCVLGVLCVDFGFFHKLFQLKAEDNAIYRAATESALAASLVIFLHVFLRLGLWHGLVRMLFGTWMVAQLALVAIAVVDPRLAATFARISFGLIAVVGSSLTLFLALRGQDRALSLIPTLLLFSVWVFGAYLVLSGRIPGDVAVSGLVAGLVLILLLIGFTVTQFAFRSIDPVFGASSSELQSRSMAIDGAGAAVWEWSARRDEFKIGPMVEQALALNPGELSCKTDDLLRHMHPADRERFRLLLLSSQDRSAGRLHANVRLRHADNSFRWFEFEAGSIPSSDGRTPKCVGLVRDVTESKRSHERLVHDAVHDSLTGLPNRELFLDRLGVALERAKTESRIRPLLILIDIDKFKSVNTTFGLVVGDSLLLTAARRLQRHLGPQDTLARIGGDQFGLLFPTEQPPQEIGALAERIRRSLRAPVKISEQELVLTGSIGVAVYTGSEASQYDLFKDAEIAMYRAKRGGADRIEVFKPDMRGERDDRVAIESDLRKALERNQLRVLYQPIIYLPTEELAGFEALVRWEHPKLGMLNPSAFVPVAEESDLIVKLGSYVLARAARDAAIWQKEMPRPERPLFVSVNVSSRQLFRPDLIQEIRQILGQNLVPRGSLRLEVTESLVMENPEQAVEVLEWLRSAGADLALDDFGTGYSSLAYLHRLPCDTIKIDRTLLRTRGARDGAGVAIVRSMVALAHELDKKVVAEGVETPEDVSFLRGIGCEYAQGFYYGEAVPDKEVIQLIRMIKKSERKLEPRGLFRSKRKKKDGDAAPGGAGTNGAIAQDGAANGAAAQRAGNGRRRPSGASEGKSEGSNGQHRMPPAQPQRPTASAAPEGYGGQDSPPPPPGPQPVRPGGPPPMPEQGGSPPPAAPPFAPPYGGTPNGAPNGMSNGMHGPGGHPQAHTPMSPPPVEPQHPAPPQEAAPPPVPGWHHPPHHGQGYAEGAPGTMPRAGPPPLQPPPAMAPPPPPAAHVPPPPMPMGQAGPPPLGTSQAGPEMAPPLAPGYEHGRGPAGSEPMAAAPSQPPPAQSPVAAQAPISASPPPVAQPAAPPPLQPQPPLQGAPPPAAQAQPQPPPLQQPSPPAAQPPPVAPQQPHVVPVRPQVAIDTSRLKPEIAASLARLAGLPPPQQPKVDPAAPAADSAPPPPRVANGGLTGGDGRS